MNPVIKAPLRPHAGRIASSESIQNSQSPRACRNDSFRAAEKSSHQGKWNNRPPNDSTIRGVSSTEPVSTITISSTQGRMLSKHAGKVRALSLTIMHNEIRGRSASIRIRKPPAGATSIANGPGISRAGPAPKRLGEGLLTPPSSPTEGLHPTHRPRAHRPRHSRQPSALSRTIAPFQPTFRESAARFRARCAPTINACPHKRPPAVMMDERVARDHRPIPRLDRPQAIIVILEAADAEPLV